MTKIVRATPTARTVLLALTLAMSTAIVAPRGGNAEQPPPPCHLNPNAAADRAAIAGRGDIVQLPPDLKARLIQLADRPHTYLPLQVFAEADGASQLFQYYLLDTTGFEPNVFTTIFPGVNDHVQLTVTGANRGLPTVGAVRVVLEPKPGLPTDPDDPGYAVGAPQRPLLLRKLLLTTAVAAVIWAGIYIVVSEPWLSFRGS